MKKLLLLLIWLLLTTHEIIKASHCLKDYAYNIYSQYGEDGIIQKIFETIGTQSKVCIEFGAWDGFWLSNTANLWVNHGWKGILIESEKSKFTLLVKNTRPYRCVPIHAFVGTENHNSLEAILKSHNIHDQIDLLSIDIDGDDYYVLESLQILRPRIIICEYNPTIPATCDVYGEKNNYIGASVAALKRIAEKKSYSLIAITDTNCFFVRNDEIHKFDMFECSLEKINCKKYLKYIITNYAGEYAIIGDWDKTPYGISTSYKNTIHGAFNRMHSWELTQKK